MITEHAFAHRPLACETGERSVLAPVEASGQNVEARGSAREQYRAAEELPRGTIVAGKYRVKAVLGRGGFAAVYDAEHLGLGRDVALKVLRRTDGMPQVLIERFLREVRISALVRHPNVLEVYDAGVHTDGSPFLAMEKIDGLTLHQQLGLQGKLSVEDVVKLCGQLLAALVALGGRGIVHRDIKPENLMLSFTDDGRQLKLVDFGIALVDEEAFAARLTQQGALVGTPHYMAPEQLCARLSDVRADIYATGVVMYQALTGVLPYDGSDFNALTLNVLHGKARALCTLCPECPASLARVVERALSRDPERRYADARSMLAALEASCHGASGSEQAAKPERAWLTGLKRVAAARHEWMLVFGTLLVMALGTGHTEVATALRSTFEGFDAPEQRALRADEPPRSAVPPPLHPEHVEMTRASEGERTSTLTRASSSTDPAHSLDSLAPAAPPTPVARLPRAEIAPRTRTGLAAPDRGAEQRARALTKTGLSRYLHAELDAAYAAYQEASVLAPTEPSAFRGLGLAASGLGRTYEARRAFTRYLELAPDAADARAIRARLARLISDEAARALRGG